jgi:hypothetical protein
MSPISRDNALKQKAIESSSLNVEFLWGMDGLERMRRSFLAPEQRPNPCVSRAAEAMTSPDVADAGG